MNLKDLQLRIIKNGLDAYLISRNNMFIGQDILDEENILQNLTGFTGSAGKVLIFPDKAYLFVDGRYEIQAQNETNPDFVEVIVGKRRPLHDWLRQNTEKNKKLKIGFNAWCHTVKEIDDFRNSAVYSFPHVTFVENDLFSPLFSNKDSLVFEHKLEFAGLPREEKIAAIVNRIRNDKLDAYLTSAADSVSWLLNIRSNCLANSPIVRAMALISKEGDITVFGDNLNYEISFGNNIKTLPFSSIEKELAKYKKKNIAFCFHQTPQKICSFAEKYKINYRSFIDPMQTFKAEKNPVEIANIKKAHLRDGIVLSKFLFWLEENYGGLTEIDVVDRLFEFRKIQQNFFSNSFDTIAGYGANGAIVHYRPTPETNQKLQSGSLLLLDSGAQYLDGTTDITRTIALGTPTQEMIDDFTMVLKAHIALSDTKFPDMGGIFLDTIARRQLWKHGKDYNHGTGHGIGYFLNVHEGPNSISSTGTYYNVRENMITSIEPGYYKEGEYGIRIENVALVKKFNDNLLEFESLTLVPFDKKLINNELLTWEEKNWLNAYHQKVYTHLESYMNGDELTWLQNSCRPL